MTNTIHSATIGYVYKVAIYARRNDILGTVQCQFRSDQVEMNDDDGDGAVNFMVELFIVSDLLRYRNQKKEVAKYDTLAI